MASGVQWPRRDRACVLDRFKSVVRGRRRTVPDVPGLCGPTRAAACARSCTTITRAIIAPGLVLAMARRSSVLSRLLQPPPGDSGAQSLHSVVIRDGLARFRRGSGLGYKQVKRDPVGSITESASIWTRILRRSCDHVYEPKHAQRDPPFCRRLTKGIAGRTQLGHRRDGVCAIAMAATGLRAANAGKTVSTPAIWAASNTSG